MNKTFLSMITHSKKDNYNLSTSIKSLSDSKKKEWYNLFKRTAYKI